ncbi:MAG TPA: class I SAM-dependent methyltransferase, partial [Candidatus Limnocylindrales bacterium]
DVMAVLVDLAADVAADEAIVELGVFEGKTALYMAWGAQQGHGACLWGVDIWDLPGGVYGPPFNQPETRERARRNVEELGFADQVTLVRGFALEQAQRWEGPPIGLLFLDDDHSREAVLANVEAWTPHLADGAVLAFDDYDHPDWPGVAEAVDELVAAGTLEPATIHHNRLAVTRMEQAYG